MGAAGGLIGGATSQVLNAANSALAGAQGKINSDVLYSHSINIILQQMKSDRAAQAIVIETKVQNSAYKNMYDAAIDLYKYARAGSWTEAIVSLEASAGNQAKNCTDQENKKPNRSYAQPQQPGRRGAVDVHDFGIPIFLIVAGLRHFKHRFKKS